MSTQTTYSVEYLAESKQDGLRRLSIAMTVLPLATIGCRLWVRKKWGGRLYSDDYILLVAAFFFLALAGLNILMIEKGVGRHLAVVSPANFAVIIKALLASECIYGMNISLTKLSVLAMYCRILPAPNLKKGAYTLGVITVAWSMSIVVIAMCQCRPIKKNWMPMIPGYCLNLSKTFIATAVPNIFTDIMILTLPTREIWKLQLSAKRKIFLTMIFLLGGFVICASIYRLVALLRLDMTDFTYTTAIPSTWTIVECAAALVSACLPTYGPVLQYFGLKLGLVTEYKASGSSRREATAPVGLVTIGGGKWTKGSKKIASHDESMYWMEEGTMSISTLNNSEGVPKITEPDRVQRGNKEWPLGGES